MQTGFAGLLAWSFLMASPHGAGPMVRPGVGPVLPFGRWDGRRCRSRASAQLPRRGRRPHDRAASLSVIIAILVYDWIGVGFLRRRWINLDWTVDGRAGRQWDDRTRAELCVSKSRIRRSARVARPRRGYQRHARRVVERPSGAAHLVWLIARSFRADEIKAKLVAPNLPRERIFCQRCSVGYVN
jgi:hypothetical protein